METFSLISNRTSSIFLGYHNFKKYIYICISFLIINNAFGQVTILNDWSNEYNGLANYSGSYTVPDGTNSNRILIVGLATVSQTEIARSAVVTYGGQTLTLVSGDINNAYFQHTQLYYLKESGIDAKSNSTLTVTVSSGTTALNSVFVSVYDNVDQVSSFTNSQTYTSGSIGTFNFQFSTGVSVNTNDLAIKIISSVTTGTTSDATISNFGTNWSIVNQQTGTYNPAGTVDDLGIRNSVGKRIIPSSNINDPSATTIGTSSNVSMTAVSLKAYVQTTYIISTSGASTFTVPAGVYSIQVEAWGAGGAGGGTRGSANPRGHGAAGGGGGAYAASTLSVTPGQVLTLQVGAGGTGVSAANGNNGNPTYIVGYSSEIYAAGGNGGQVNLGGTPSQPIGGIGGSSSSSVGTTKISGANGLNGNTGIYILSGAGGSGGNGGIGGAQIDYDITPTANGNPGTTPGGGGGGARTSENQGDRIGGTGGNGQIIISWDIPTNNFRTIASGDWNNANIWEQQFKTGSWAQTGNIPTVITSTYTYFPTVSSTATSANISSTLTHAVSLPTNITSGDLLLILWADANIASTVTIPSGWNSLYNTTNGNYRYIAMYKVASGSEGNTLTVSTNVAEVSAHTAYRIASGSYSDTPVVATTSNGTSTAANSASLTSGFGTTKTLWIATAHTIGVTTITPPNSYSNLIQGNTGATGVDNVIMSSITRELITATENCGPFYLSSSGAWGANIIAIKGATYTNKSHANIKNSHTVTITNNTSTDSIVVESGGKLIINNGINVNISSSSKAIIENGGSIKFAGGVSNALLLGNGSFTLENNANIEISSPNGITSSTSLGNIQLSGTRSYNNAANYTYDGTTPQTTGDGLPATINKLTINNSTGLTLTSSVTVLNTLSLTNGIITTNSNTILLTSDANYTGGSNTSHVNGTLRKTTNNSSTFIFPNGDGLNYRPISIVNPSNNTWSSKYYNIGFGNSFLVCQTDIPKMHHVSDKEYWDIHPENAGGTSQIMLTWNDNSDVLYPEFLLVAHWNSTNIYWENIGSVTINTINKTITSNTAFNNFSPFSFGSTNNDGALPIEIVTIDGFCNERNEIELSWTTASETNNELFIIQKSYNGIDWQKIATINGAGNSSMLKNYNYKDLYNSSKFSYYRILQKDFNGTIEEFDIMGLFCGEVESNFKISPIPVVNHLNLSFSNSDPNLEKVNIIIYNEYGGEIQSLIQGVLPNSNTIEIDLPHTMKDGVYIISVRNNSQQLYTARFTKKTSNSSPISIVDILKIGF